MVALGGCYALQERDIVPGREISIIGFDDVADASFATPSLTTIQTQPYKLGQLLAKTIICLLYTSPSPRDRTRSRMPSSA